MWAMPHPTADAWAVVIRYWVAALKVADHGATKGKQQALDLLDLLCACLLGRWRLRILKRAQHELCHLEDRGGLLERRQQTSCQVLDRRRCETSRR